MFSKTKHRKRKLGPLLRNWPRGMVANYHWFMQYGITRQLVESYKRSAWITPIGNGAYVRTGDPIHWTGGLYAIQQDESCSIHAGGKTALSLLGYAHFIEAAAAVPFWLFGKTNERLPRWFLNGPWKGFLHFVSAEILKKSTSINLGLTTREISELPLRISTPELAMLEVLYFVPQRQSVEEAYLLMEGLGTLRPKLVQQLLEACNIIKIKRLFLALADICQHHWFQELELSRIDLGRGNRMLLPGGYLHPKYHITLPASILDKKLTSQEL